MLSLDIFHLVYHFSPTSDPPLSPVEEGRRADSTAAVLAELVGEEGLPTLYRGIGPVLQSLFCSNFVYFYTFHGLKRLVVGEHSAPKDLLMAMTAGTGVVKERRQKYPGI